MRLYTTLTRRASVLGLAVLLVTGCGPNPNALGVTDRGSITGTLVDARNNTQAIQQAVVSVGAVAQTITAANNGGFTLQNVPTGTQTVHVSAPGYQAADIQVVVRVNQTTEIGVYQLVPLGP